MTTFVTGNNAWGSTSATVPSVAQYIARLQQIADAIVGCGMIQTADTGQLNIAAIASVPAANTDSGYHIYRFNDSVQGTWPLFVKIRFGSGDGQSYTRVHIRTGTGSDGAGALTGQLSNDVRAGGSYSGTNGTMTLCQTYACHTEGFFGLNCGPNNNVYGFSPIVFMIGRTRDAAGNFDGLGNIITNWDGIGINPQSVSFTRTLNNQFANTATSQSCIVPGLPADTALINGDKQLYPHFYADPSIKQMWHQCTVRGGEFGAAPTSLTATVLYGVPHTMLMAGSNGAPRGEVNSSSFRTLMIWE